MSLFFFWRLPAALQPVGLLQVSLSLQPLPSLRSVQWPASPPFVSLARAGIIVIARP